MRRRKPLREKRKKGKLRNKLIYGIFVVCLVFICFLAYSSLRSENPSSNDQTSPPKAALIDHLSFSSPPPNETFKTLCRTILESAGFNYTYYRGEEVTVDFYEKLPTYGYSLIILRVHSAVIKGADGGPTDLVGLFTSEICNETTELKYSFEIEQGRLARARLFTENETYYFGITPWFVKLSMEGNFKDTVILMMGCEGLNKTSMADALVHDRKAKVYISWTGPVTKDHTDDATIRLLMSLVQQNQTIKDVVEGIGSDPIWTWSHLDYYPKEVGDNILRDFISGLTLTIAESSLISYKVCLFSSSNRFETIK